LASHAALITIGKRLIEIALLGSGPGAAVGEIAGHRGGAAAVVEEVGDDGLVTPAALTQ